MLAGGSCVEKAAFAARLGFREPLKKALLREWANRIIKLLV